jgi:hypothetical protein
MDYSGKIIKKTPVVPSQTSASGVWTLDEAMQATKSNTWPVANVPDPISRSLRFRSSASAYLNRTPATAGNRRTFTYSAWVKRGAQGTYQTLLWATTDTTQYFGSFIQFYDDNTFAISDYRGSYNAQLITSQVLRDPSAWYHIVWAVDTTQATASNRIKLYINGVQVTSFSTATYPAQNFEFYFNAAGVHNIGRDFSASPGGGARNYFDGYITENYLIDGQALTPSSFGGTNAVTGVWEPRPYTGTYGTNGFLLTFSDNTSTTTLGNDTSGNSNNWTTNNISLTAGSTYDSMLDVPTQWIGYNTGDVASVTRGNYCTLNPLSSTNVTLSNANLTVATTVSGTSNSFGTMGMPNTGKWYWEYVGTSDGREAFCGISNSARTGNVLYYGGTGAKLVNNVETSYGATYTNNDVIGVAVDVDTGNVTFYKNNVSQGAISNTLTNDTFFPFFADGSSSAGSTIQVNFGQRPFAYTPPAGFLSLCTTNLPSPTILQGNQFFNAITFNNQGGSYPKTVTGSNFQPDFVWIKSRTQTYPHYLFDSVRGTGVKALSSNSTGAEGADGVTNLSSFNSNGFTAAAGDGIGDIVGVYWAWRANQGTNVTNTAGSITSTVSANTTAGFSVVTYTGTGSDATVGHGLNVAPSMIFIKTRNITQNWIVYSSVLGKSQLLYLNSTDSAISNTDYWGTGGVTSTVFGLKGGGFSHNLASQPYVAYCFAAVAGYSAMGSYTGNGSSDGTFVFTGFMPRYVMIKQTNTTGDWQLFDTARSPTNVASNALYANGIFAEDSNVTNRSVDFLSNGFKIRSSGTFINASGGTFIYMAFAENPFKNALAR